MDGCVGTKERAVEAMHISGSVGDVIKEIQRRYELRRRLEAESAEEVADDAFLAIVRVDGLLL